MCITAYKRRRNAKRTRIFSLAFTVIEPFGVLTKKARTAVLALGSLELRASLAVLAFKRYWFFFFGSLEPLWPCISHIEN